MSNMKEYEKLVNTVNTILIELELEGDIINQNWYEYDYCSVMDNSEKDTGIIVFAFYKDNKKIGAFITNCEDIATINILDKNRSKINREHVYIHVKGKKKPPLILNDMAQIFKKEVPLPADFSEYYLYNSNRKGIMQQKLILNQMFRSNLFKVTAYELATNDTNEESQQYGSEEKHNIYKLKEYNSL